MALGRPAIKNTASSPRNSCSFSVAMIAFAVTSSRTGRNSARTTTSRDSGSRAAMSALKSDRAVPAISWISSTRKTRSGNHVNTIAESFSVLSSRLKYVDFPSPASALKNRVAPRCSWNQEDISARSTSSPMAIKRRGIAMPFSTSEAVRARPLSNRSQSGGRCPLRAAFTSNAELRDTWSAARNTSRKYSLSAGKGPPPQVEAILSSIELSAKSRRFVAESNLSQLEGEVTGSAVKEQRGRPNTASGVIGPA